MQIIAEQVVIQNTWLLFSNKLIKTSEFNYLCIFLPLYTGGDLHVVITMLYIGDVTGILQLVSFLIVTFIQMTKLKKISAPIKL